VKSGVKSWGKDSFKLTFKPWLLSFFAIKKATIKVAFLAWYKMSV